MAHRTEDQKNNETTRMFLFSSFFKYMPVTTEPIDEEKTTLTCMGVTYGLAIKRNNKETKSRVLKRYLLHWQVNEILKYKQHPNYTINSNRFFVLFFGFFVCVYVHDCCCCCFFGCWLVWLILYVMLMYDRVMDNGLVWWLLSSLSSSSHSHARNNPH